LFKNQSLTYTDISWYSINRSEFKRLMQQAELRANKCWHGTFRILDGGGDSKMKRICVGASIGLISCVAVALTISSNSSWAQETRAQVTRAQVTGAQAAADAQRTVADKSPAMERTRKQAKMLDTLYKSAIVLITENYVDGKESLAAGDAFQALFKTMKDNGFHEVRLLDATGDPYDSDNEAKTEYEKKAVKAMLDGASIYEEVVKEGDKTYLLSTTPIPVVMDKCVMCHSSYEGQKGAIGALGLKLQVE